MEQKPDIEVARLLILGYLKHRSMLWLAEESGIKMPHRTQREVHHGIAWLPNDVFDWIPVKSREIRPFVSHEWPKLSAYLIANGADAERMERCAHQVVRLRCVGKRIEVRSAADTKDAAASRRNERAIHAANRAARKQQLSTQRGAWNVCK